MIHYHNMSKAWHKRESIFGDNQSVRRILIW